MKNVLACSDAHAGVWWPVQIRKVSLALSHSARWFHGPFVFHTGQARCAEAEARAARLRGALGEQQGVAARLARQVRGAHVLLVLGAAGAAQQNGTCGQAEFVLFLLACFGWDVPSAVRCGYQLPALFVAHLPRACCGILGLSISKARHQHPSHGRAKLSWKRTAVLPVL